MGNSVSSESKNIKVSFENNSQLALKNCKTLTKNFLNNFKSLLIYRFSKVLPLPQSGGDYTDLSKQMVKIIKGMDTRHVINDPKAVIHSKENKIFFMCNGLILHLLIHDLMYLLYSKFLYKLTVDNYQIIESAYRNNKSFKSKPLIVAIYQAAKNSGYGELLSLNDAVYKLYHDLNSYQAVINHIFPYLSEKQKKTRIPLHKLILMIENSTSNEFMTQYLKIIIKHARN